MPVSADRNDPLPEPEIIPPDKRAPFEDERPRVRMSVRWRGVRVSEPNLFVKILVLAIAILFAIVMFVLVGALMIWIGTGIALLFLVLFLASLLRRRRG
jgi:hypothetical protein